MLWKEGGENINSIWISTFTPDPEPNSPYGIADIRVGADKKKNRLVSAKVGSFRILRFLEDVNLKPSVVSSP